MLSYYQMSNRELLSILIGERKGETVADALLREFTTLPELLINSMEEELKNIRGIGSVRAKQIKVCYELSRRLQSNNAGNTSVIKTPLDVTNLLMHEMRYLKKEVFKIILLNVKNNVIAVEEISMGSLNQSIVHPREVYLPAIKKSASGLIAVHNHPSGDPSPSREDIETTIRLMKAGEVIGIKLLDHIVIGDGRYISFKEEGHI